MNDKRKPPETEEDIYDIFLDLFDEVAPDSPEEIDEFLREKGYDPVELANSARSIFREALETSPLDWRNRARQEIEDAKTKMAQHMPKSGRTREEVISDITSIERKRGAAIAAHFKNLDLNKVSYEDLESMLADLQHLENDDTELDE